MKNYLYKQWKAPYRLLYKGYGITIWKWCGIFVPLTTLHFGKDRLISFDIFHHGYGFRIYFSPLISIDLCIKGKFHRSYDRENFRFKTFNFQFSF